MEHGACNIIYIDRRANDEHVRRESLSNSLVSRTSTGSYSPGYFNFGKPSPTEIHTNVEAILSTFNEVYICSSGASCLARISHLHDSPNDPVPTLVLIDVPYDEDQRMKRLSRELRTPSPTSTRTTKVDTNEPEDIYGMYLLLHISSEIQSRNLSKLVVPVVVLSGLDREWASNNLPSPSVHGSQVLTDTVRLVRYLDAGAVDVLSSPLSKDHVHGLAVHAYRIHKEVSRAESSWLTNKRNRKLSWVGVEVGLDDAKPYAYLREAMVSSLMSRICNPESVGDSLTSSDILVEPHRMEVIAEAIGSWSFSAHDFTDDELLYGALLILKHALQMPELEGWRMSDEDLTVFLLASRTAYNDFVLYHNFRHVTDVLQALFYFLVRIGILPAYARGRPHPKSTEKPAIANLLKPFDALTLLVSAIGHDVGHPGVNNAFLVALNAPLAQLYNDRSVLESFHCAAYSQILRRYWPVAFSNMAMRKLMINSILATDMGLHFKYMSDLNSVQEKLNHTSGGVEGLSAKLCEDYKDLTCGLLIKCADISNVARKFGTAARWAAILTDEFSNQGVMEEELQIPSCLFGGPPARDDIIKMGESQIGFMKIFAKPLFEAVADILPAMRFSVEEILVNMSVWEKKIEEQKERNKRNLDSGLELSSLGTASGGSPSQITGALLRPSPEAKPLPSTQTNPEPSLSPNQQFPMPTKTSLSDDSNRRSSGSSHTQLAATGSRRSSLGVDRSSPHSSGAGFSPGHSHAMENQSQSRRGSGDASLTAIFVTQSPNSPDSKAKDATRGSHLRSVSPSKRKDAKTKSSLNKPPNNNPTNSDKLNVRPVTAPSPSRRGQATHIFPITHPTSQSHSEVDLSHASNGNLDGSRMRHWDTGKQSDESNNSHQANERDTGRRGDWWKHMSHRRRTRDMRNGNGDGYNPNKEIYLAPITSNSNSNSSTSPTQEKSRSGKLRSLFRRKPKSERDLIMRSAPTSTPQLRTPTSNPGISVTVDD